MLNRRSLAPLAGLMVFGSALSSAQNPAAAQVPKLADNGAFGYFASVSLFGGPPNRSGPAPSVTLPAEGARAPVTAVAPTGKAQFGPAVLVSSGEQRLSTQGTLGPGGTVTSTASITGTPDGPTPLLFEKVTSTCTAKGSELVGSTTLAGQLATSIYVAPDPREGEPKDLVPFPPNPAPNTERTGEVNNIGDRFRVVYNEQTRDGGVLTVNAVHLYLLGPVAMGDLVLAQSRCGAGVTAGPPGSSVPAAPDATVATTTAPAAGPPLSAAAAEGGGSSTTVIPVVVGASVVALSGGGVLLRRRRKAASAGSLGNGGT